MTNLACSASVSERLCAFFIKREKKTRDPTETLGMKAIPNPTWAVRNSSLASVINTKSKTANLAFGSRQSNVCNSFLPGI